MKPCDAQDGLMNSPYKQLLKMASPFCQNWPSRSSETRVLTKSLVPWFSECSATLEREANSEKKPKWVFSVLALSLERECDPRNLMKKGAGSAFLLVNNKARNYMKIKLCIWWAWLCVNLLRNSPSGTPGATRSSRKLDFVLNLLINLSFGTPETARGS